MDSNVLNDVDCTATESPVGNWSNRFVTSLYNVGAISGENNNVCTGCGSPVLDGGNPVAAPAFIGNAAGGFLTPSLTNSHLSSTSSLVSDEDREATSMVLYSYFCIFFFFSNNKTCFLIG